MAASPLKYAGEDPGAKADAPRFDLDWEQASSSGLAKLIKALACPLDSPEDYSSLRKLLLMALVLIASFSALSAESANWLQRGSNSIPRLPQLSTLLLVIAAIAGMTRIKPGDRWQGVALLVGLGIVLNGTIAAVYIDNDELLSWELMALLLITSLLVPWKPRYQTMLSLAAIPAFGTTAFTGAIERSDVHRWLTLAALSVFAVAFCAFKQSFKRQLELINNLRDSRASLKNENLERQRVAKRLVAEVQQRRVAEKLACNREEGIRQIFEASPDSICVFSLNDLRVIQVNQAFCALHGLDRREAIGKSLNDLDLLEQPEQRAQLLAKAKNEGGYHDLEIRLRASRGRIIDGLLSGAVIELDGESVVVAMVKDISDRKEMERNLIAARETALAGSKAKSKFLSSMSHEIRTPMNAILGMSELLGETELSREQQRYLEIMTANGNALLDLINSILDIAKIEAGRMPIEQIEFDLTDLIDKTISTFGVRAHGKGLELAARIEPGVPDRLIGDPLRLRQILINLLGNAIKFTEIGQIVLTVAKDPNAANSGDLIFTVADTGIGIPADMLREIFSNFTQADTSTTRKYGGSGLGLAIAQRLTGLMGGGIAVESAVGKGSKFSFTAKFGVATRVLSPAKQVVLSLSGYRVLVVDDNQVNRLIVREMISACGADIDEADSGARALEAVAVAETRPYHIVLLDMRMPGMDGLEVARKIREAHLPIEPVILMLSSDDLGPQLARMKELGLAAYLVKPVRRKELFEAISRVLEDANRRGANPMPERRTPVAINDRGNQANALRILVAEDSPDNRLLVEAYLRREPHQVDFAENGKIAVAKFTAQPYDLVFMDVQMPELDGLDATRLIRGWEKDQGLGPVPIIALTASVLVEDVQRAMAAGCTAHIAKPVKKQVILDAIRTVVLSGSGVRQSASPGGGASSTPSAA